MQPYTDRFRAYRKLLKPYFGSEKVASQYIPLQDVEARRLLWRILKDQGNLTQHIQTFVTSLTSSVLHKNEELIY
jgi:hypothetical protein